MSLLSNGSIRHSILRYIPSSPYVFRARCLIKHSDTFTLLTNMEFTFISFSFSEKIEYTSEPLQSCDVQWRADLRTKRSSLYTLSSVPFGRPWSMLHNIGGISHVRVSPPLNLDYDETRVLKITQPSMMPDGEGENNYLYWSAIDVFTQRSLRPPV